MGEGYIYLHREILDHWVYKEPEAFKLWVTLLLLASHKEKSAPFSGGVIELKPGMFITSRPSLARRSGVHESKINRLLKRFEIEQQIEQRISNQCRVISIVNWPEYQWPGQQTEHPMNNQRTTNEHNQERKKEINTKEENKIKEKITLPDFISQESWDDYRDFRKSKKKGWTPRVQTIAINKLTKLHSKGEDINAVIEQSIFGGWPDFYPVKDKQTQGSILDQRWKETHGRTTAQGTAAGTESVRNQLSILDQQTR